MDGIRLSNESELTIWNGSEPHFCMKCRRHRCCGCFLVFAILFYYCSSIGFCGGFAQIPLEDHAISRFQKEWI